MDKTRRFEGGMLFCGANSGSGFVSFFDDILKGVEKTYILKGGPGTGKSHFMRRAAEYASERGLPVEYYACSSDPDSLDAIVVDGRIAIADGTAPHVLEARAIGARDEIVDLGAFWDPDALSGKVDEIESLGAKKSACYRRAYAYLKAERELSDVCRTLVLPYFKYEKALRAVDRLFSELKTGGANTCRHRVGMIDSIGMKGRVRLDTFEFFAEKIYAVDDAFGTSGLILQMMYDKAKLTNTPIVVSYDPLDAKTPTDIFFINDGIAFVSSAAEPDKRINMKRFVCDDVSKVRREYRLCQKQMDNLSTMALNVLHEAGEHHFALEAIYSSCMDFDAKDEYCSFLIKKIFG